MTDAMLSAMSVHLLKAVVCATHSGIDNIQEHLVIPEALTHVGGDRLRVLRQVLKDCFQATQQSPSVSQADCSMLYCF